MNLSKIGKVRRPQCTYTYTTVHSLDVIGLGQLSLRR